MTDPAVMTTAGYAVSAPSAVEIRANCAPPPMRRW
jgi:hypothetical protein